ncbi:MAG: ampE, partial [Gammaproteobacteria bacterium]|nr:ampE [Gammaproteobacteria bacterium]
LLCLFSYLLEGLLLGLFSFLLSVIVLFFCLRLYNPRVALAHYFEAGRHGEDQSAFYYGIDFLKGDGKSEKNPVTLARHITRKILSDADQYIFSVLFWYVIFGLSGAVVYSVVRSLAAKKNYPKLSSSTVQAAKQLHALLNWLPTRIVGLTYALVGHASYGFAYWRKHLRDGLNASREFASGVGLAALEKDPEHTMADIKENEQALAMVDGAFLLWIVVIGLCTLVAWVA